MVGNNAWSFLRTSSRNKSLTLSRAVVKKLITKGDVAYGDTESIARSVHYPVLSSLWYSWSRQASEQTFRSPTSRFQQRSKTGLQSAAIHPTRYRICHLCLLVPGCCFAGLQIRRHINFQYLLHSSVAWLLIDLQWAADLTWRWCHPWCLLQMQSDSWPDVVVLLRGASGGGCWHAYSTEHGVHEEGEEDHQEVGNGEEEL